MKLSTGKKIGYDLLSLDSDGALCGGYDSQIEFSAEDREGWPADDDCFPTKFTAEERREIADLMITRWRSWAGISETRKLVVTAAPAENAEVDGHGAVRREYRAGAGCPVVCYVFESDDMTPQQLTNIKKTLQDKLPEAVVMAFAHGVGEKIDILVEETP